MKPLIITVIVLISLAAGLFYYNYTKNTVKVYPWPTQLGYLPNLNDNFLINSFKMTQKNEVKTWNIKINQTNLAIINDYLKALKLRNFEFIESNNISDGVIEEIYTHSNITISLTYNAMVDDGRLAATIVVQP